MKAWYTNGDEGKWEDIDNLGVWQMDKDGYCTCKTCQKQKKIEEAALLLLPEELFEL